MVETPPSYRVPCGPVQSEIREKGSRFLAIIQEVAAPQAARALLEAVRKRHPDATHHCWAWRLGWPPSERSSDAGEPAGTAGLPILQVLRGANLSDTLAVVVRWFGGTKLGKGGLARAYAAAMGEAVARLETIERAPSVSLELEFPYHRLGAVRHLIHPPEVGILDEEYGERVRFRVTVPTARREALEERLRDLGVAVRTAAP